VGCEAKGSVMDFSNVPVEAITTYPKLLYQLREMRLAAMRYEKVRRLNVQEFSDVFLENLKTGVPFDDLIDRLTKE
jgi:hypothetical protein